MFKLFKLTTFTALAAGACLAAAQPAAANVAQIEQIAFPTSGASAIFIDQAPAWGVDGVLEPDALPVSLLIRTDALGAEARVEQTGASAYSLIVQEHSLGGLYAEVHQTAPAAQSFVLQSGEANTALVYQTISAGAYSSIVQSGAGNVAIVRQ